MDLEVEGKVAIVLGASGGLGRAVARTLAAEGAHVAAVARNAERLSELSLSAEEGPGQIVAIPADLCARGAAATVVDAAVAAVGRPQIVVLNAPGPPPGRAAEHDIQATESAWRTIVVLAQEIVALTLPSMRAHGWGRVIAIGSSGMITPIPGLAASNTARAALAAYLKTLAGEVAADGVTVNIAVPGRIDTDRVRALDAARAERENREPDQVRAASQAAIPAARYGRPEEFAAAVGFLAGGSAGYITGMALRCDGGLVPVS